MERKIIFKIDGSRKIPRNQKVARSQNSFKLKVEFSGNLNIKPINLCKLILNFVTAMALTRVT